MAISRQLSNTVEVPSRNVGIAGDQRATLGLGCRSVLGHTEIFDKIEAQLAAGDNVVMLANHQTEADPAVCPSDLSSPTDQLAQPHSWLLSAAGSIT